MITLFEPAYAKINLTLDVLGKREDGYHDLKSIMQTVSLQDDIILQIGTESDWKLTCSKTGIPCDPRNLAWKAAEVFFSKIGKLPNSLHIHIEKRIPSEAGLGGGSADAAAVLRALNRYYGKPFSAEQLAAIGAEVGSDVPFCVKQGTAMAEGRGERLRKLPDMPKQCYVVICKPDFSVSTPVLYRKIDETVILRRPDQVAAENALLRGDLIQLSRSIHNVFDPLVASEHPEINHIKSICLQNGAIAAQMTGSGSAVFAITNDENTALSILKALESLNILTFLAQPV